MPVIAEDPVERFNRKAFSFHVGEFDTFSVASPNVKVDVKLRIWDDQANGSCGLEQPAKIPQDFLRNRFF